METSGSRSFLVCHSCIKVRQCCGIQSIIQGGAKRIWWWWWCLQFQALEVCLMSWALTTAGCGVLRSIKSTCVDETVVMCMSVPGFSLDSLNSQFQALVFGAYALLAQGNHMPWCSCSSRSFVCTGEHSCSTIICISCTHLYQFELSWFPIRHDETRVIGRR